MRGLPTSRRAVRLCVLVAVDVLLSCGATLYAQQRVLPPAARRGATAGQAARAQQGLQGGAAALPPGWVEQLQEMTPAEQERFLRNNLRFRSLPAQYQALIRRRLRAWNNLPLDQRQALIERQQIWEQLPQEQRRQVRESLLPRWQSLPEPSRQAVLGKLRELRGLDLAERNARLNDDDFLGDMNSEERQMLLDLSNLGVGQPG